MSIIVTHINENTTLTDVAEALCSAINSEATDDERGSEITKPDPHMSPQWRVPPRVLFFRQSNYSAPFIGGPINTLAIPST